MPVGIEAWVTQIPPVTRTWLALSVLTRVAVVSGFRPIVLAENKVTNLDAAMPARDSAPALLQLQSGVHQLPTLAHLHEFLLLRVTLARLCVPHVLLVSVSLMCMAYW